MAARRRHRRREVRDRRHPGRHARRGRRRARCELLETIAHVDDHLMEKYLDDEELDPDEMRHAIRVGTLGVRVRAGAVRLRVQEQGRAAHARRGRRLPAVAARHPADRGHRPEERARDRAQARARTSRSPRSRSRSSPTPTASSPTSASTRASSRRARRSTTRRRTARSASAASCACTRTSARTSTSRTRATSSPVSASSRRPPATRSASAQHPIVLERMEFPEPVISRRDRAEDQERPGQAGQGARFALRRGPDVPGPHRRRDRPDDHLAAWASCTSRCSSTA